MTRAQKNFCDESFASFASPMIIEKNMRQKPELRPYPTRKVIQRYASNAGQRVRDEQFAATLAGFKTYATSHVFDIASPDHIGCIGHEVDLEKGVFRFAFTSPTLLKRLLLRHKGGRLLVRSVDGTYKLNWQGYPVLVFGVVDAAQQYHPIAIAITKHEKEGDYSWFVKALEDALKEIDPTYDPTKEEIMYAMADAAESIRKGLDSAMDLCGWITSVLVKLMCWSHQARAFDKGIKEHLQSKRCEKAIHDDLRALHRIPHPLEAAFHFACKMAVFRWTNNGEQYVAEYFNDQWCNPKLGVRLWGLACKEPGMPATNNGQERHNRVIKDLQGHRRLKLNEFARQVITILNLQTHNRKDVVIEAPIPDAVWRDTQVYPKP